MVATHPHSPQNGLAQTNQSNQLIGLSEVSRMLGVNRATVANWLRQGRIPALQYGERGMYRLRRADVLSFIEQSRLPTDGSVVGSR